MHAHACPLYALESFLGQQQDDCAHLGKPLELTWPWPLVSTREYALIQPPNVSFIVFGCPLLLAELRVVQDAGFVRNFVHEDPLQKHPKPSFCDPYLES